MSLELTEYPEDYRGRKTFVFVVGCSDMIPKYKTYLGADTKNHILPEFGGAGFEAKGQAPFVVFDKAPYFSPLDKTVVAGRTAHRDHMKRHGVVEAGDMKIGEYSGRDNSPMGGVRDDIHRAMNTEVAAK